MPDLRQHISTYVEEIARPITLEEITKTTSPLNNPPTIRRSGPRLVLIAAVLVLVAMLGGLVLRLRDGDHEGDVATDTTARTLAPFCDDLPELQTTKTGSIEPDGPSDVTMSVLYSYAAEHEATFGGMWIDRDQGVVVLTFTDDPAMHLDALLQRGLTPGDTALLTPAPSDPDATTVEESGLVVDVLQSENTQADAMAALNRIEDLPDEMQTRIAGLTSSGLDVQRTVAFVQLIDPTDADRAALAEQIGADFVCVKAAPPGTERATPPTTISPEDIARGIPARDISERWKAAALAAGVPDWQLLPASGGCTAAQQPSDPDEPGNLGVAADTLTFDTQLPQRPTEAVRIDTGCTGGRIPSAGLRIALLPPVSAQEAQTLARLSEAFVRFMAPDASSEDLERIVDRFELAIPSTYEVPQVEMPSELPPAATESVGEIAFTFTVHDTPRDGDSGEVTLSAELFDW